MNEAGNPTGQGQAKDSLALRRRVIASVLGVLAILVLAYFYQLHIKWDFNRQVVQSVIKLNTLRDQLREYHNQNGAYPSDTNALAELHTKIKHSQGEFWFTEVGEICFFYRGDSSEYRIVGAAIFGQETILIQFSSHSEKVKVLEFDNAELAKWLIDGKPSGQE